MILQILVLVTILGGAARAETLMTSGRQLSPGALKVLGYYEEARGRDLSFSVGAGGRSQFCKNPPTCSVVESFAAPAEGADVEAESWSTRGALKLLHQPWEGLQYYAWVGSGDFSLRIPSATVANTLEGDRRGWSYGLGVRAVLNPDTVVTPAITLDLGVSRARHRLDRLDQQSAGSSRVAMEMDLRVYQASLEASHRFPLGGARFYLEPYGGLRYERLESRLTDLNLGSREGGAKSTTTPFLGLAVPLYERERIVAEASFVNGIVFGVGLEIALR